MSQTEARAKTGQQMSIVTSFCGLLLGAAGIVVLLALLSYHPTDLSFLSAQTGSPAGVRNISGVAGAWVAFLGRGGLGQAAFAIPLMCVLLAVQVWQRREMRTTWSVRLIAASGLVASLSVLAALASADPSRQMQLGGIVGYLLAKSGRYYLGAIGTGLLSGAVAIFTAILAADRLFIPGQLIAWLGRPGAWWAARRAAKDIAMASASGSTASRGRVTPADASPNVDAVVLAPDAPRVRIAPTPKPKPAVAPVAAHRPREAPGGFQLPSLELLTTPPPIAQRQLGEDLQVNARILVETLREFGIEATCVNIDRGPSVTRYELAPAPGVKITKIVSLADDLALVLKAASCHIVAPIPGKGLVGVEVANSTATVVYLKEILTSAEFQQMDSPLALPIGKDVSGKPLVHDLRECPHLLVAGATGSGKTVFLNSLLTGILTHASPDQVKFLMIDPKMVELAAFNEIPHLVAPVVTETKKAAPVLNWAVMEMDRRYRRFAELGVRNITTYNQKAPAVPAERGHGRLPYLVVVIDELADLMMVSPRDVEESITRLAQMARAVGIHVILATQRPSVDVITGVIKANFPARIAFQVSAKVDSRTILDANGADKLLGRGDMLFLRPGTAKPIRAQGALLTDPEIERVVAHLRAQRPPVYDEELLHQPERDVEMASGDKDEMYEAARKLVIEARQASTSLLQRRLRLGYGRAARILDLMEQEGIVGPPQGSRPREVLVGQHAESNHG